MTMHYLCGAKVTCSPDQDTTRTACRITALLAAGMVYWSMCVYAREWWPLRPPLPSPAWRVYTIAHGRAGVRQLGMTILDDIPFSIDPDALFARLHLAPDGDYAGEIHALIDSARRVARPRALYRPATVQRRDADAVLIAASDQPPTPVRFESRALRVNLDGVEQVFAYVATCGRELDAIPLAPADIFGQFCHDTIKEMALWVALVHLHEHLTDTYGLQRLASMNPGSGEANVWPIEQQRQLFAFLGNTEATIGVVLTESCLMRPNKSVSGIFYPSENGFESCQLCRREDCPERRVPFDPGLWERTFAQES